MLKKHVLKLVFIFLIGSVSYADTEKPKHYIYFVHGLAGTEEAFGEMPTELTKRLDIMKPAYEHVARTFSYHTGSNKLDTYQFAFQFADKIYADLPRLNDEDKISFVTHSQGGVITSILLFNSFAGVEGHIASYINHVDNFVTVGTPYWGSKLADIVSHPKGPVEKLIQWRKDDIIPEAGLVQLREMSLFSDTIRVFRNSVMSIDKSMAKKMFSQVNLLNIGGIANVESLTRKYRTSYTPSGLTTVLPFVFGGQYEYEADMAVSLPSSRVDSIYIQDLVTNYEEDAITSESSYFETDYADFVPVYGIHASPVADRFLDLAYLPKGTCQINFEDCLHPSYEIIYKHFIGEDVSQARNVIDKRKLGGYVISFDVELPVEYKNKLDDIEIELVEESLDTMFNGDVPNRVKVMFSKPLEYRSDSSYVDLEDSKKTFHYTGAFHYKGAYSINPEIVSKVQMSQEKVHANGAYLTFEVSLRGFKTRYVRALVKPLKSTFVKVNLEPKSK